VLPTTAHTSSPTTALLPGVASHVRGGGGGKGSGWLEDEAGRGEPGTGASGARAGGSSMADPDGGSRLGGSGSEGPAWSGWTGGLASPSAGSVGVPQRIQKAASAGSRRPQRRQNIVWLLEQRSHPRRLTRCLRRARRHRSQVVPVLTRRAGGTPSLALGRQYSTSPGSLPPVLACSLQSSCEALSRPQARYRKCSRLAI
jgi:hypothetical protein